MYNAKLIEENRRGYIYKYKERDVGYLVGKWKKWIENCESFNGEERKQEKDENLVEKQSVGDELVVEYSCTIFVMRNYLAYGGSMNE